MFLYFELTMKALKLNQDFLHLRKTCSPEALGIVPGAIFMICLIICLVGYAKWHPNKVS